MGLIQPSISIKTGEILWYYNIVGVSFSVYIRWCVHRSMLPWYGSLFHVTLVWVTVPCYLCMGHCCSLPLSHFFSSSLFSTFPIFLTLSFFSLALTHSLLFLLPCSFLHSPHALHFSLLPPHRCTHSTSLPPCSTKSAIILQSWRCGTRHQAQQRKMMYVEHSLIPILLFLFFGLCSV